MTYESFRCGLTFTLVARELRAEQVAAWARGERMFFSRRTVLGRMRQHKLAAWHEYLRSQQEEAA